MKNSNFSICSITAALSALCVILSFIACAPRNVTPLYLEAEFSKTRIAEPIYLLSFVDLRVDKAKNLNLDDNAMRRLSPSFEKKGYGPLKAMKDRKWVESVVEDDFTHPDSSFLAVLGPEKAHYLFCPVLHDFKSKLTFGSTANAEVSGYIVDKKRGKIVWKHKGLGQAGQGGLMGMAMKGLVEEEAVNTALLSLSVAIPQNGIPKTVVAKK
ncbi:MAG: hypothetical protein H7246_14700 [Phycisphaerae bacterium]|nr:hypothetical protein [Saprospiraceae bacterium]